MSHRNRIYKVIKPLSRIILILTAIILSLLILEISIRISSFKPSVNEIKVWDSVTDPKQTEFALDKNRVYKLTPEVYSSQKSKWGRDSEGFRYNPDHIGKERKDYQNIVIIGDSFTYGHGVGPEETFPFLLEQNLNSNGHNVWVDNAGVPGYGFDQEFIYLRDEIIPRMKPDIVVWGLNHNDLHDSNEVCLFKHIGDTHYQISGLFNSLYFKNQFFKKVPQFIKETYLYSFLDTIIPERYTLGCSRSAPNVHELEKRLSYFFGQLKILSESENFIPLVAIMLNQHFFEDNQEIKDWDRTVLEIVKVTDLYTRVAEQHGIPILDTNIQFTYKTDSEEKILGYSTSVKTEKDKLFLEEDYFEFGWRHTNKKGNDLMSELVANTLEPWVFESLGH